MDKAKMLEKLNEILRWEWAGMIQYTQFSFVITGNGVKFIPKSSAKAARKL